MKEMEDKEILEHVLNYLLGEDWEFDSVEKALSFALSEGDLNLWMAIGEGVGYAVNKLVEKELCWEIIPDYNDEVGWEGEQMGFIGVDPETKKCLTLYRAGFFDRVYFSVWLSLRTEVDVIHAARKLAEIVRHNASHTELPTLP